MVHVTSETDNPQNGQLGSEKEMSKPKRADLKDYKVIFTFRVLYDGWEMDNEAWVGLNNKGKRVLLMTNHGGLWDYGSDVSGLRSRIEEAANSITGIQKAIELIKTAT